MTDTVPIGLIVVRLTQPVKNYPVGTELGYKDVADAIAALGSAHYFEVVRDQQGNPIPPLTPEEIEEAQRAAQRRAKSRRLILGADFDPLWDRVDGIPSATELEQMRQDVEAVADVPGRVEAVETQVGSVSVIAARADTREFDARKHGFSKANANNIPAINAAIAEAAAAGGGRVVLPGSGAFAIRPSGTTAMIQLRSNVTLDLGDVILRVADDAEPYSQIISALTPATYLENATIRGGMIDQNSLGNETADVVPGSSDRSACGMRLWNFRNIRVEGVTFEGGATNFVILATSPAYVGYNAFVDGCTFRFVRGASSVPDYDNSAVYLDAIGQRITNNRIESTISQGARGAMEIHGIGAVVSGNTAEQYKTLLNLTSSGHDGDDRSFTSVTGNVLHRGNYGIQLWPEANNALRGAVITDNIIDIAQRDWDLPSAIGIGVERNAARSGDIFDVSIHDNIITFQPGDTRATTGAGQSVSYASSGGIATNAAGNVTRMTVKDNLIVNAPSYGVRVGDSTYTKIATDVTVAHNTIIDAGQNSGLVTGGRAAIKVEGNVVRAVIRDNDILDTGPDALVGASSIIAIPTGGEGNTVVDNRVRTASGLALTSSITEPAVRTFTKRQSIDLPSIAPDASAFITLTVPGAKTTDMVLAQPQGILEVGLFWVAWVSAADTVTVRVTNTTAAAIDPTTRTWRVRVFPTFVDN